MKQCIGKIYSERRDYTIFGLFSSCSLQPLLIVYGDFQEFSWSRDACCFPLFTIFLKFYNLKFLTFYSQVGHSSLVLRSWLSIAVIPNFIAQLFKQYLLKQYQTKLFIENHNFIKITNKEFTSRTFSQPENKLDFVLT